MQSHRLHHYPTLPLPMKTASFGHAILLLHINISNIFFGFSPNKNHLFSACFFLTSQQQQPSLTSLSFFSQSCNTKPSTKVNNKCYAFISFPCLKRNAYSVFVFLHDYYFRFLFTKIYHFIIIIFLRYE
ncbi:hypothetical protein S83_014292 [Arachis hypogaea]